MPKFPFLLGAGVALAAGGALLLELPDLPRPAAAMPHAAMMHGTPSPALSRTKAAPDEVVIDNYNFGPTELTVPVGTKVTWTNDDSDTHTVTSEADPKVLKSPPLDTGDSFAFTFDKPGTYRYFCSLHPRMQGTIVVQ